MATARVAWGIDVGNRALKAIKLVREGDGLRIDDVEVIEHEHVLSTAGDNRETLIHSALANFVQRHNTKGSAVAVGVTGQQSLARFIKLPPVEPKKIPEIVRFEAIQQIPFPLEDVEWSYQLFQDANSPDVEVGIFAMRKELVNQHIKNFTDAGLNVQVVQMNPLAVYNAIYHDQRIKGTTMIVDLGAENTDLIIAEGETIWVRSIPIGGNNFTEALVKSFKLKFPKAEEYKRNAATSKYGRQIMQAMRPVFADLVAEIQRSIGFYASVHRDSRISRVLTLGGTFRLPGLMKYLQQNLQLDVLRIDRLGTGTPEDARLAATLNENLLSLVGPYGLALQAMGEGKITSSLLPQHIRRERMWREKTKWFATAASLAILCPAIAAGRYYYDRNKFDQQATTQKTINDALKQATDLDKRWKEIEQSGEPDRTQIAAIKGLESYRQVWSNFLADVNAAMPKPQAEVTSGEPEQIKKIPRNQRKQVVIHDIISWYDEDLGPKLAMKEEDFKALAGQVTATPVAAPRATTPPPAKPKPGAKPPTGAGAPKGAVAPAGKTTGRVAPPPPGGGDASSDQAKARGYLVTVHCTTPYADYRTVVDEVRNALVARGAINKEGPRQYSIARVSVPLARKVDVTKLGVPTTPIRSQGTGGNRVAPQPRSGGTGGVMGGSTGGPGMAGTPGVPGPGNTPANDPRAMPVRKGSSASAQPQAADVKLDPLTGEDRTGDFEVTFLVAVQLDPPPVAKPEAATADAR